MKTFISREFKEGIIACNNTLLEGDLNYLLDEEEFGSILIFRDEILATFNNSQNPRKALAMLLKMLNKINDPK
ncbi:hypothetical protein KKF38_01510 [Patescibacteria group bacterium]|nr:hypothetical protein [Patescibacteria group bacterium]